MLRTRCIPVVILALVVLAPARARAEPERERAAELFRRGNEEFSQGRVHRALEAYRAAWLLGKSFDIACNLGRAEAELGMSRDAAEHLDYCLRNFPASGRPELREAETRFRELFQRVRSLITVLTPMVEPAGASIALNGEQIGVAPLAAPVFVQPGQHRVSASLAGYEPATRVVDARAGESHSVRIALQVVAPAAEAPAVAPVAAAPPAQSAENATPTLKLPLAVAGAGLTLVSLSAATLFSIRANDHAEDAERLRETLGGGSSTCRSARSAACDELQQATDAEQSDRRVATAGFVASGIFAVATLGVWLLWPESPAGEKPDDREISVAAELSPAAARVGLTARF